MKLKRILIGGFAVAALAVVTLVGCIKSEPAPAPQPAAADSKHDDRHAHEPGAHGDAMPAKLGSAKEQKVFFTPGGMYTAADIKANGATVPSIKYGDVDIDHDDSPKPGEKVCPISKTKANPKLTWMVGGKSYEFCCTPCVQEFVQKAKEKPGDILDPAAYVKKAEPDKK